MEILREYINAGRLKKRGVAHCFTGTLEEAQDYLALGFLISFTGIIAFSPRKSEEQISPLQKVVQQIPFKKVMIETDAPYLAPPPHRGERNEPRYVVEVVRKLAELHGKSLEEVIEATNENAKKFFGIEF
jgi:TatD DNase family protein